MCFIFLFVEVVRQKTAEPQCSLGCSRSRSRSRRLCVTARLDTATVRMGSALTVPLQVFVQDVVLAGTAID